MSDTTIYLAGPVAALDDGGATWRDDVAALADGVLDGFDVRDPLAKYNAPAEDIEITATADPDADGEVTPAEIVKSDKELLRESDAILVGYVDVQSIGTPMEVMWAFERDYPIVVWTRDDTNPGDVSPWYRHHADAVVSTRPTALELLRNA